VHPRFANELLIEKKKKMTVPFVERRAFGSVLDPEHLLVLHLLVTSRDGGTEMPLRWWRMGTLRTSSWFVIEFAVAEVGVSVQKVE